MSYDFLLTIAIIMLFTKVFGLTSERVHMPQVVGALIAGVLVGPSCLGWVGETDFLVKAAEIGVIILMFNAGMDTDLDELKTTLAEKGITFTWDDVLLDYLVKKSYSVAYGARNLRRAIQTDLEDPIAERIIRSYVEPFRSIKATCEDGKIRLETL